MKRQRGRGRNKPNGQSNRHFESNGPDIKIRGSASHICEKYQQLARDASSSGDRVTAENYLQHAEHYFRILRAQQPTIRERPDINGFDDDGHEPEEAGQPVSSSALDVVTPEPVAEFLTEEVTEPPSTGEQGGGQGRGRRSRRRRFGMAQGEGGADAREALEAVGDARESPPMDPAAGQ